MGKLSRSVSAASVAVVRAALVTGCTTQADFEALRMKVIAAKAAADRDPALTTYPLGILLANEAISEDQHRAGCRYAS